MPQPGFGPRRHRQAGPVPRRADQAEGLCFSVAAGQPIPSSLRNIFKELATDIDGYRMPSHGSLEAWARQGVLLLNTSLTVRAGKPLTHSAFGWRHLTEAILRAVATARRNTGVVVLAWGRAAQNAADIFVDVLPPKHPYRPSTSQKWPIL